MVGKRGFLKLAMAAMAVPFAARPAMAHGAVLRSFDEAAGVLSCEIPLTPSQIARLRELWPAGASELAPIGDFRNSRWRELIEQPSRITGKVPNRLAGCYVNGAGEAV